MYVAESSTWIILQVILAEAIVQAFPAKYSYLASSSPPEHNTYTVGPDNLLYVYNGWSANWVAGPQFYDGGLDRARIIENPQQHFQCFDLTQPAQLTIYAVQPIPGTPEPNDVDDVGHSFLSITQNGNTRVFGFYPTGTTHPLAPSDPAALARDTGHAFDVSVTFSVTATELASIVNYTVNALPERYDLNSENCTHFVVDACNAAGIALPQNPATWPMGGGLCPGRFGEDIRTLDVPNREETRNLTGGTAPQDSGTCN